MQLPSLSSLLRMGRLMWRAYEETRFSTNVAALTYTTVLSVVPLLALALAIGRGFGLEGYLEMQLRANLNVQEGVIEQLMSFANGYISRTQDGMIVGVSLLVLVFTLISLVNNIEEKFNAIWGVKTSRPLLSFSLSYLGLVVFLVFAFVFMSGLWISVLRLLNYLPAYDLVERSLPVVIFVGKSLASSFLFVLMYKFIPLPTVQWRNTLVPGLLAGTLFTLVQEFYVQSQLFLSSYNAVYGSFALLPLLMMWLYLTWTIGLGGALLSYVLQCGDDLDVEHHAPLSHKSRDVVDLLLLRGITQRFLRSEASLSTAEWARSLRLSVGLVGEELQRLERIGLLCHLGEGSERVYKLDTDVYQLSVGEVLRRLDEEGGQLEASWGAAEGRSLMALREAVKLEAASDCLVKDL